MKMLTLRTLLFTLFSGALLASTPELHKVKSVYLLPMAHGLDQYLAGCIQSSGIYLVVTDPQSADAVFTDTLGPAFEQKFDKLYPPEKAEPGKATEPAEAPVSSFRKARGMVFLVERRSRQLVWSTYALPKSASPDQLERTARRVVERLKKDLTAQVPAR